jgi:hypothetical protein
VTVSNIDCLVFAGLYYLAPEVLDAETILKRETVIKMASRWIPSLVAPEIKAAAAVNPGHLMRFANSFAR